MTEVIALRMDDELLKQIDKLSKKKSSDRSRILRTLIKKGFSEFVKEEAVQLYKKGIVTFSEAAHRAGLTLWEMHQYLVSQGFTSDYSIEDLEQEMSLL